jgi:hypothetical protein
MALVLNFNSSHCWLLALSGSLVHGAAVATPLLRCELTYAGSSQTLEAQPGQDPYTVPSVEVGGRFRFKAVVVGTPVQVDYIKLYAYLETSRQPILVQQATYLPPFQATSAPYALTGEQRIYAGPAERELLYSCTLQGVRP